MANSTHRELGWLAVFSGVCALAGFGLLVAALAAPPPSPETLRRSEELFRWQDAGVLLQALTMIPLTLGLREWISPQSASFGQVVTALGLASQSMLAVVLLFRFADMTSDMLYMIPQGFVGAWLILFNLRRGFLPNAVRWVGLIAGFGLVVVCAGVVTYGIFVAPAMFVRPLSDAEIDAQTWTTANVIAHICLAAGTLLGRATYPVWLLLLGRALLRGR